MIADLLSVKFDSKVHRQLDPDRHIGFPNALRLLQIFWFVGNGKGLAQFRCAFLGDW
ncbi:MAG: hypothetical protein LH632_11950 [Rhodoferax sp.]|nr:hypothetical protein [Rhodoferax sp.]